MAHSYPSQQPVSDAVLRRRSADVGGLHLAIRHETQGQGWLDSTGSDAIIETEYAELLTTMYRETLRLVENNVAQNDPPELSPEDRVRLLKSLESWYFEPLQMPEHEVLACVLFLFQVLFRIEGMKDAIKVDINVIPRFILHIRQLYRWQNHYHNFEHAVDVLQAIHCYLRTAGMVPPVSLLLVDADAPGGAGMWSSTRVPDSGEMVTCLTPHEIFALYLAAIGHDVAHPGFNNPFMQNAEAPLSQVYDNRSALEQMHSFLLLTTMRHHGLGVLLDDPQTGTLFRKILKSSVLATDMGVHKAFMDDFTEILDGMNEQSNGIVRWQSTKCSRQAFICQVLLKNADISNPCRPILVSKQWASALQQEWACQYKFENFLELEHSVHPSNGPLAEANSQVFFTRNIAKPLVDLTTIAMPELRQFSYHCAENLRAWERILEELKEAATSTDTTTSTPPSASSPTSTSAPTSSNPSPASSSAPSSHPSSSSSAPSSHPSSSSPTRQNSTIPTASNASSTTPGFTSSSTPPPPPFTSPTPISTSVSGSISSASSSSNPVSPRILNPSEADYSNAFRLALPRTAKSDGASMSPGSTPGSASTMMGGSILGSGRRQPSRTPSSSGGGRHGGNMVGSIPGNGNGSGSGSGSGVLSPSLSRGATRRGTLNAASGQQQQHQQGSSGLTSRTYSNSSTGSSDVSPPAPQSPEMRRYPSHPHSHSHPHAHVAEDRSHLDGYRFPPPTSPIPGSSLPPPPPPPTADPTAFFSTQAHTHSSTSSASVSLSPSDSPSNDTPLDVHCNGTYDRNEVSKLTEEDEYELDVQAHRANFHHVLGLGLGVGSLKKKKSGSVIKAGSSSSLGPGGGGCYNQQHNHNHLNYNHYLPVNQYQQQQQQQCHNNRASWCSGEPLPIDVDREVRTVEDAKGAIERWTRGRGRWASFAAAVGGKDGEEGVVRSRAVAAEESGSEGELQGQGRVQGRERGEGVKVNGTGCGTSEPGMTSDSESVPAGLVSPARDDLDPQTPPQQTGALDVENENLNRSGSPTPKAKPRKGKGAKEKEKECEEQRRREEERREELRRDLIRQEEEEKRKEFGFLSQGYGAGSDMSGKRSARSRSRSKARRKGKGKK